MKKKNVVKKEAREKKTYERTPVRILKPKANKSVVVNKPAAVNKPVVETVEEKETIKKQHNNNKRPKPAPVETVENTVGAVEKVVETVGVTNNNVEYNEQNIQ